MNPPPEESVPVNGGPSPSGVVESRPPREMGDLHKGITMAQIAKAAGVSQGAISSLLNDRDYGIRVSEKTRERVFRVCREMGYMPNDLRAVVRMYPELGEFCLLLARDLGNAAEEPVLARVASAAVSAVPKDCRSVTIARYDTHVDYIAQPENLPQPVRIGVVSKFIAFGHLNSSLISTITHRGLPCVILGATQHQ